MTIPSKIKKILAGMAVLLLLAIIALVIASAPRVPAGIASVVPGTNVVDVAITMTQGTNHQSYYPSRIRWELSELYQRLGWAKNSEARRMRRHTYQAADTFWVACTHQGPLPYPQMFRAEVVTAQGTKWHQTCTGGVRDTNRSITVTGWSLHGGIETHRGSTLQIVDTGSGAILTTIQMR